MSSGFTGSTTKGLDGLDKEVETRMSKKRLDLFTDEFSPPGVSEAVPGADFRKPSNGYGKPHEDFSQEEDNSRNHSKEFKAMAAAGDAREQEAADTLDEELYQREAQIKKPSEQFPGGAAFDQALTDPMRLKAEVKMDLHRPERIEQYKGHSIYVYSTERGYQVKVGNQNVYGNFPGITTAVQRAHTIIDSSEREEWVGVN